MTQTPSNVQRGRLFVILAAAITLIGDGIVISMTLSNHVGPFPYAAVARWLLTAGLFYVIWQGHRWALWMIVALVGIALVMMLPQTFRTMHPFYLAVAAQFVVTLGLLLLPNSVSAFQEHQRAKIPMEF